MVRSYDRLSRRYRFYLFLFFQKNVVLHCHHHRQRLHVQEENSGYSATAYDKGS